MHHPLVNKFDKLRLFYVHIPKTGGNSVLRALRKNLRVERDVSNREIVRIFKKKESRPENKFSDHSIPPRRLLEKLKSEGFLTFSTVRNPFARAYSCWEWHNYYQSKIQREAPINKFEKFLEKVGEGSIGTPMYKPQTTWLYDDLGLKVDKVCKLETLRQDMEIVCKQVGFELQDADFRYKYNVNSEKKLQNYREAYDDNTRRMAAEIFKSDIELFEYTF